MTERSATSRRDEGFSLVEIMISVTVSGMLIAAASAAFVVALRVMPTAEVRIDDARSTRGLATYLAQDTTSAPGFEPEQAQGGFDIDPMPGPDNNDCGAPASTTNLLHLQWVEVGAVTREFVANYRSVVDGDNASVVRYTCERQGAAPFTVDRSSVLARGLDPSALPVVTLVRDTVTGEVLSVKFRMTAKGGDEVLVETGPRNPSEFFAP